MVYTDLAPRRQQFHVAPAMQALKYTTSVDIQKTCYKKKKKKKLVTHRITCKRSESAQESGEKCYISDHQSICNSSGAV